MGVIGATVVDQKGLERGDGDAKTGKGQSRNIRYLIYKLYKCDLYNL